MPVQPKLFPDPPPEVDRASASSSPAADEPDGGMPAPLWIQRMSLFVLVLFCVYLGVILIVLPWWPNLWDHNLFFQSHPRLWAVLQLGAVRGIISGLGLLDIWIGISEAVNYRDHRA
jgi:hypothetical protein